MTIPSSLRRKLFPLSSSCALLAQHNVSKRHNLNLTSKTLSTFCYQQKVPTFQHNTFAAAATTAFIQPVRSFTTRHLPQQNFFSTARMEDTSSSDENENEEKDVITVTQRLQDLIDQNSVQPDEHQWLAAAELDRIQDYLMTHDPPSISSSSSSISQSAGQKEKDSSSTASSFFGSLFGMGSSRTKAASAAASADRLMNAMFSSSQGAYLYGGVGCGKTFLMNLFYDSVDTGPWAQEKQKVHFHKFMLEVHRHMHQSRKKINTERSSGDGDLIAPVVDEILKNGRLLCLDEFQVTDVADALILQRLFDGLWSKGCILVATSNRPPSDLYLNGLQRDRFIPFIHRIEEQCAIVDMLDSDTDYRMLAKSLSRSGNGGKDSSNDDFEPNVFFLQGQKDSKQFRNLFFQLAENHPTNPRTLTTQGRNVPIPLACTHKRIAFFNFSDVCQKAMGPADYLVIANHFSTVFCHNIPKLTIDQLNWLRRFITFVDTMYELKVTLVLHTAQPCDNMNQIFTVEGAKEDYSQDEVFAFDRTLSRLEEMSSLKYLQSQWQGGSKKRREASKRAMLQSFPSYLQDSTGENGGDDVVESKLAFHPSLDNHYVGDEQTGDKVGAATKSQP